jgi:hypothetical protein
MEFLIGVEIFDALNHLYEGDYLCWVYSEWDFQHFAASHQEQDTFVIVPQKQVPGVGHVDLAIFVPRISINEPLVVVECDGHEFHERTPQQASEDNRRDRVLQRRGFPVLRFTGTDIMRNSSEAAREVTEFVHMKLHEKVARLNERLEYESQDTELTYYRCGAL